MEKWDLEEILYGTVRKLMEKLNLEKSLYGNVGNFDGKVAAGFSE